MAGTTLPAGRGPKRGAQAVEQEPQPLLFTCLLQDPGERPDRGGGRDQFGGSHSEFRRLGSPQHLGNCQVRATSQVRSDTSAWWYGGRASVRREHAALPAFSGCVCVRHFRSRFSPQRFAATTRFSSCSGYRNGFLSIARSFTPSLTTSRPFLLPRLERRLVSVTRLQALAVSRRKTQTRWP